MDKIELIHAVMMLGADTYNKTHIDRYEAQLKAEKLFDDYVQQVKNLNIPAVINRRELLLAYHEFYLNWRKTVTDSSAKYCVEAFLSKQ